ncbi:major facilitator superfamily domain-containing protein [Lanmaoa asiatica]|nr:major facilitator superfamily domain-containing protein [Lanmaoa asiatica]
MQFWPGLWSATFLSALNSTYHYSWCETGLIELAATLVATLLPSISSEFEKSNEASWLGTSYLLAVCTFTPLYGRLCNVLGRRGANQTAVIAAALGTAACGYSRSMEMLIVARFVRSLSATCIVCVSVSFSIITQAMIIDTTQSRGLAQGFASLFNGLGMGLGGPIGGLVSDWFGWRWAFIMQLPLFALSLFLTTYHLRYVTPGKAKSTKDILKRIDWGGSFTLLVAVGAFLTFLSMKFNEDYTRIYPERSMAVGTGFGQVFRGVGQVCGVAISSALFQFKLKSELRARIHTPDADEVRVTSQHHHVGIVTDRDLLLQIISRIRHSATLVAQLPQDLQRVARDSYAVSLRAVFFLAACSTLLAYIVRLPIPDKDLEQSERTKSDAASDASRAEAQTTRSARAIHSDDDDADE